MMDELGSTDLQAMKPVVCVCVCVRVRAGVYVCACDMKFVFVNSQEIFWDNHF